MRVKSRKKPTFALKTFKKRIFKLLIAPRKGKVNVNAKNKILASPRGIEPLLPR